MLSRPTLFKYVRCLRGLLAAAVVIPTVLADSLSSPYWGVPATVPGELEAEDFDLGGEGHGYHDKVPGNAGGEYRPDEDVDIIVSRDTAGGDYDVNNFETGEWLGYTIEVPDTAVYELALRAASAFDDSAFRIEIDGQDVTGRIAVPNTGGWNQYQWVLAPAVSLCAGEHLVKIVAEQQYFNLNSLHLQAVGSSPYRGEPFAVPGAFEAEDFDLGGEDIAYHDNVPGNAGGEYRPDEDVDIIVSVDAAGGNYDVNNFETGEWLAYTIEVAETGDHDVALRAASAFADGAFRIEIDGRDVSGRIPVPNTGGWSSYQWIMAPGVSLSVGRHLLKIVAEQQYFNLNSVRVRAAVTEEPESVDPGAVLFSCTFANLPTDCGFREQAKEPGRASIVNVARDGATAVRLHTEPGDNNVAGSGEMERNDLWVSVEETDGYEGREHWWAHSILFPDDFAMPTWHNYVVFDFHNSDPGPWQANFHVAFQRQADTTLPGLLSLIGYGGVESGDGRYAVTIGPATRNVWYDFVYHVRWSSGSDGFFDAWLNGKKILAHRGPTLYAGQGVYLKLANYHVPVCDPYPACIGSHGPSSVIHDRVIRGTTALAVSSGPLEGELELVDGVLTPIVP